MGFVSIEKIKRESGYQLNHGGGVRVKDNCVRISLVKNSKDKSHNAVYRIRIVIGKKLEKLCRLMLGDRVDLLFDFENRLAMIRRADSGYKLSFSGKTSVNSCAVLTVPLIPGLPKPPRKRVDIKAIVDVNSNSIVFDLPKETEWPGEEKKWI